MSEPATDSTDPTSLPLFAALGAEPHERRLAPAALRLASAARHDGHDVVDLRHPVPTSTAAVPGGQRQHPASAPSNGSGGVSRPPSGRRVPGRRIDWSQVRRLRAQASERFEVALSENPSLQSDRAQQEELGRAIILDLLREETQEQLLDGREPWDPAVQDELAAVLFDAVFRLGRLQPLLDDERIENIIVNAFNDVTIELSDGTQLATDPIAESNEELVEFLNLLASRYGRAFSEAEPELHLALPGEARLAAAWTAAGVSVVIRRNRLRRVTLDDLVQRGTLSRLQASFLRAAVRDRRRIVVSGAQGAGKTTLVRALGAEIPLWDHVGTFETEYELFLHKLRPRVHAWESRPGSGERGPDGRRLGEYTLDQCLHASFRFNLQWQILGEVRGGEVLTMIEAMQGGAGSLCTTHARNARGAIERLVTAAIKAGPHISETYARRAILDSIDLVVHLEQHTRGYAGEGEQHRQRLLAEILAVNPRDGGGGFTDVFVRRHGRPAAASVFPDHLRGLVEHGFDLNSFLYEAQAGEGE